MMLNEMDSLSIKELQKISEKASKLASQKQREIALDAFKKTNLGEMILKYADEIWDPGQDLTKKNRCSLRMDANKLKQLQADMITYQMRYVHPSMQEAIRILDGEDCKIGLSIDERPNEYEIYIWNISGIENPGCLMELLSLPGARIHSYKDKESGKLRACLDF